MGFRHVPKDSEGLSLEVGQCCSQPAVHDIAARVRPLQRVGLTAHRLPAGVLHGGQATEAVAGVVEVDILPWLVTQAAF